jgi:UDP-N-acetylmuramyl pentapeptide phosphotransferase/UDP-N-acetylglucosamine-1-phosphate transferase
MTGLFIIVGLLVTIIGLFNLPSAASAITIPIGLVILGIAALYRSEDRVRCPHCNGKGRRATRSAFFHIMVRAPENGDP